MKASVNELIATGKYNQVAIKSFYSKMIKKMEKQNQKIQASPALQKSYSVCDPIAFADQQVRQYLHTFEIRVAVSC